MSSKAGEISSIIKEQIKQYESKIEMKERGLSASVFFSYPQDTQKNADPGRSAFSF